MIRQQTARQGNNLYVVNRDWTISHVGWAGHMAFSISEEYWEAELIRVDYEKYIFEEDDYILKKVLTLTLCYGLS